MLKLSDKWAPMLTHQAETGMGYQVVSIHLLDGRRLDGVADIVVTHDKRSAAMPHRTEVGTA